MTTKKFILFFTLLCTNLYQLFAQGTAVQPAAIVKYQLVVAYDAKATQTAIQAYISQMNAQILDFDDKNKFALIKLNVTKINNVDYLGNPQKPVKATDLMNDCKPYSTLAQGVPPPGGGGNAQSQGEGWNYSWQNGFTTPGGSTMTWGTSAFDAVFYAQFKAMSATQGNCSVQVAIDDSGYNNGVVTGVEPSPFLNMLTGTYKNYINPAMNPVDSFGHGTFVTGITTGVVRAISRTGAKVKIVPYKILNKNGEGSFWTLIRSLADLSATSVNIINLSVRTILPCQIKPTDKHPLILALNLLKANNKLLVCASGNDALNIGVGPYYVYPAALSPSYPNNMLTVGSISATKALSSFSNYGTPVQLYTYGENIISTLPGNKVGVASGTSFAAPQVTGASAILATYQTYKGKCSFSPSQITNGLKSNGDSFTGQTGKIVNFEKTFKKMFSSLENDNDGGASIDLNQNNSSDRNVSLSASPNPFNTDLNISIKLPEGVSKATLSLIDSRGMLLQQQDLSLNNQDNLNWVTNDAPIGLYFLRVQADNGEVQTIKLIKN